MKNNKTELVKSQNHEHFWIEDNTVYESYRTIRGLRYMAVAEVIMPDSDRLSDDEIKKVNEILTSNAVGK